MIQAPSGLWQSLLRRLGEAVNVATEKLELSQDVDRLTRTGHAARGKRNGRKSQEAGIRSRLSLEDSPVLRIFTVALAVPLVLAGCLSSNTVNKETKIVSKPWTSEGDQHPPPLD